MTREGQEFAPGATIPEPAAMPPAPPPPPSGAPPRHVFMLDMQEQELVLAALRKKIWQLELLGVSRSNPRYRAFVALCVRLQHHLKEA